MAALRLKLRPDVRLSTQQVRGELWTLLTDPASGRHHRFNRTAQALICGCDGRRTLDELWSDQVQRLGDDAPSQAEAIRLVAQAFAANLLVGDIPPDAKALIRRQGLARKRQRQRLNPLAWRVALWNPDALLDRVAPAFGWLLAPATRWLIGTLLLFSAGLALLQADAVGRALQQQLGAGESRLLLLMWLAYPLIKALHEAAHALLVKLHGGHVPELGVSLLFLSPVPYVDAAAASAFPEKGARIAVAAAGIVLEALLASAALGLWLLLEPGLARDIALAVMAVAGLSTLLVNGNPLMRFDGYHVLCDAAELPNLAARSNAWWLGLVKRRGLLLRQPPPFEPARGEHGWLLAYAPLSWACRAIMLGLMAVTLAQWSAPLGLLVLAYGTWVMGLKPLGQALLWLARSPETHEQRARSVALAATGAALALAAVFGIPLPDRSSAPGLVWLPDDAMVRLETEGVLLAWAQRDGAPVAAGQTIAWLDNPALLLELKQARSRLAQVQVERMQQFDRNAAAMASADDEIARLQAQLNRLEQRVAALEVRARVAGRLVLDTARTPLGKHLQPGDLLAHVLPPGAPMVRALVHQDDAALVRQDVTGIEVRLAHGEGPAIAAQLAVASPSASARLPSRALGEAAGGPLALDSNDREGLTAREPRLQFDLRLPEGTSAHVGARARVVFSHGQSSLATLLGRRLRQAFLRHFER